MSKKEEHFKPVSQEDFDAAMRQILLAEKPHDQRSEERTPTKAELETRYRLERRARK